MVDGDFNKFRLIHISDLHFFDSEHKVLPDIFFELLSEISTLGVLVSGDLTTAKPNQTQEEQYAAYEKCVRFLKCIISPFGKKMYIVVGNHDVNRNSDGDFEKKFELIEKIISKHGFEIAIKECRTSYIGNDNCLQIIEINSCKNLDLNDKDKGDPSYFREEDIERISSQINKDSISLPLILAHHNIVPKCSKKTKKPEFFDAGHFRETMLKKHRTILYVHGHLHKVKDPLIIKRKKNAKLICISAPRLFYNETSGENLTESVSAFNVIEFFTVKNIPIGCKVKNLAYHPNTANIEKTDLFTKKVDEDTDLFLLSGARESISKYELIDDFDHEILENLTFEEKYACDVCTVDLLKEDEIAKLRTHLLKLYWLGYIDMSKQDYSVINDDLFDAKKMISIYLKGGD